MRKCEIEGCNNKHFAKGYCRKHYTRYYRHGDPNIVKIIKGCEVPGCNNKHNCKGLCNKHYLRFWYNGTVEDPIRIQEIHGKRHSPEYAIWCTMKQRCYNKNNKDFKRYGGRGIKICGQWRNSFKAFFNDMGCRPSPDLQIDRIDNNGNYEPENCRWVTRLINVRNRSCVKVTIEKI